jgi:NADPH:quinone reductase-like Zn-dependent oxidoreductase
MTHYGTVGEQTVVPVSSLGEYPSNLSPVEGAAIWMQYVTAYGALIHFGHLTKGDFVLITAASSSVGLAAIEIAKAEGAISIATTRTSSKKQKLLAHGASHVIATEEEDLVSRVKEITAGKGAGIIFDPIAGPLLETLAGAAARNGIIFEYGLLSGEPTPFPVGPALLNSLTVRGYILMEITLSPDHLPAAKKYVYDRLQDGRFRPTIAKTFPFARARNDVWLAGAQWRGQNT